MGLTLVAIRNKLRVGPASFTCRANKLHPIVSAALITCDWPCVAALFSVALFVESSVASGGRLNAPW